MFFFFGGGGIKYCVSIVLYQHLFTCINNLQCGVCNVIVGVLCKL